MLLPGIVGVTGAKSLPCAWLVPALFWRTGYDHPCVPGTSPKLVLVWRSGPFTSCSHLGFVTQRWHESTSQGGSVSPGKEGTGMKEQGPVLAAPPAAPQLCRGRTSSRPPAWEWR